MEITPFFNSDTIIKYFCHFVKKIAGTEVVKTLTMFQRPDHLRSRDLFAIVVNFFTKQR